MARRKKTRLADDLIEAVSLLPWWAGVALAVVLYLTLHSVATQQVASFVQPGQGASFATQTLWKTLASIGQYALPLICLAGAAISVWQRHEPKALVDNVVQSKSADALNDMSWTQFELLVGEGFRLQGYTVTETGGGGADGGVDLVLAKGSEKFLVQCKQWRAFKVGVKIVRELYGVMTARGAAGGFVVTSGRFTDEATSFASGRNIKLVDGPKLHGLIQQAQAARAQRPTPKPAPSAASTIERAMSSGASAPPTCPLCSKPMVKRTAKRGANAGSEFWGCTGFPACKGTRQAA